MRVVLLHIDCVYIYYYLFPISVQMNCALSLSVKHTTHSGTQYENQPKHSAKLLVVQIDKGLATIV